MRSCPTCKARYANGVEVCAVDGEALVEDELSISMSDTMQSEAPAALAAGVNASPTPAPLVRSNPTPGPAGSPRTTGIPAAGPDPVVGSKLAGRYEVTRKIGEGGMGAVYEARHSLIGKRVAIKVLLDKYVQKADVVARLQQEARLASSIGHENIVDITDFGETDDGRTFVVMEFLDGESLAQLLQREGPLPPSRVVLIARQVASALGAAHGKGIVHRDIKPENVFICRRAERDYVKVVDFGISKAMRPPEDEDGVKPSSSPRLTQTGMVLGTPLYMSPEQARGEDDLDHRIDVYALGVIMYEAITGEVPYRGTNYLSIISQVLSQDPKRPTEVRPDLGITPALESVILKAMAKDRAFRYASMADVDADLAGFESGGEVKASSERRLLPRHIPGGAKGRSIAIWGLGVGVVILAIALIVPRVMKGAGSDPKTLEQQVPLQPPPQPPPPPPEAQMKMINAQVTTTPPGATIWWGSRPMGVTPKVIEFPRGADQISFTLKLEGYEDATVPFYPTGDQTFDLPLHKAEPPPPPGTPKKPPRKPPIQNLGDPKPPLPPVDPGPGGGETKPNPYGK